MSLDILKQEQERLLDQIESLENKYRALQSAIDILEEAPSREEVRGYSEVRSKTVERLEREPREVSPRHASPPRPVLPPDTRPLCAGCGGRMEPAQRELSNGKVVQYLSCTDSGCNNEQLA
jgi:hypothetical protein